MHDIPETWDADVTPPPMELSIASSRTYDSIPPEIADRLRFQEDKIAELTQAIGRVWSARDAPRDIEDVQARLQSLSSVVTETARHGERINQLMPMVRALTAHVNNLAQSMTGLMARFDQHHTNEWPRMDRLVDSINGRVSVIEKDGIATKAQIEAGSGRVAATSGSIHTIEKTYIDLDERIGSLETDRKVQHALSRRERQKAVGLSSLAGAVAAILASLIERLIK